MFCLSGYTVSYIHSKLDKRCRFVLWVIVWCSLSRVNSVSRRKSINTSACASSLYHDEMPVASIKSWTTLPNFTFSTQFHYFVLVKLHWFGINWHVLNQSQCRNCCLYIIKRSKKNNIFLTDLGSIRVVKTCDIGLEYGAFLRPRSKFFTVRTPVVACMDLPAGQ